MNTKNLITASLTTATMVVSATTAAAIDGGAPVDMNNDLAAPALVEFHNYARYGGNGDYGSYGTCTGTWLDDGNMSPQWAIVARHCVLDQSGNTIESPYDPYRGTYAFPSTFTRSTAGQENTPHTTTDGVDIAPILSMIVAAGGLSVLIWYLVELSTNPDGFTPGSTSPETAHLSSDILGDTNLSSPTPGSRDNVTSDTTPDPDIVPDLRAGTTPTSHKQPITGLFVQDNTGVEHKVVDVRYPSYTNTDLALVQVDSPVYGAYGRAVTSHPMRSGDRFTQYGAAEKDVMRVAHGNVVRTERYNYDAPTGSYLRNGYIIGLSTLDNGAMTRHGDSGGPILNMDGELLAVNSSIYNDPQTGADMVMSIPVYGHREWITAVLSEQ